MKKKFWIAVDKKKDGWLFLEKPKRVNEDWENKYYFCSELLVNHLGLTWKSEPYEIEI